MGGVKWPRFVSVFAGGRAGGRRLYLLLTSHSIEEAPNRDCKAVAKDVLMAVLFRLPVCLLTNGSQLNLRLATIPRRLSVTPV